MNIARIIFLTAVFLLGERECFSQSISWNGAGDGTSWNDANNWVGMQVPGPGSSVFITNAGGGTVVIPASVSVTVENILCSNALTISLGGAFTVTEGSSLLQGALIVSSEATLSATGAGTTLTSGGSVTADDGNFYVGGGAVMTLPGLRNYAKNCSGANWTVTDANSVLNLSGLTSLTGAVCNYPTIQAEAGGHILATNLGSIVAGPLAFAADGTNSLIEFSGLTNCAGQDGYLVTFEASSGGTMEIPKMTDGPLVGVILNPGGTFPVAQIQTLSSVTASGVTASFPGLTNFDDGNFYVSGGAVVTLPALQNYNKDCNGANWTVTGSNSVLKFPVLTNITGAACSYPTIQAVDGGQILAANLASIEAGPLAFAADGANSLIDLAGLTNCAGQSPYLVTFEASGGGTMQIPNMEGGPFIGVTLNAGGLMPVAQIQTLYSLIANGVTVSFPGLSNFDDANFYVSDGAVVTLPALRNYNKNCNGANWTVTGLNSVLNLPALTNITGAACSYPTIQAAAGGQILATNLTSIEAGPLAFAADGTNSLIDLSGLTNCSGQGQYYVTFEASDGGTMEIPNFTGGVMVGVILNPGGTLPVAQIQQLASITVNDVTASFPLLTNLVGGGITVDGGSASFPLLTNLVGGGITVDGGSVSFSDVTNIDEGSLYVSGGGVLSFPGVRSYTHSNCGSPSWQAQGVGSVLNLSGLTNLVSSSCNWLYIQASGGGGIILNNVTTLTNGYFGISADGAGTLVDFSKLVFAPDTSGAVDLTASDSGEIRVPDFIGGPDVNLSLSSDAIMDVAQYEQLFSITIDGMSNSFPGITNFDEGSLYASGGGTISMPALQTYTHSNCASPYWQAQDSDSIIDLSKLTNVVSSSCNWLFIQASAGGGIILSNITTMTNGYFGISADGAGTLVDLSKLASAPDTTGNVDLTASDAGEIRVPNFIGGPEVNLSLSSDAIMAITQYEQLAGITINGMTVIFPQLENFDEGSLSVSGGGVLSLPALQSYMHTNCSTPSWRAQDADSVIDLSNLTNLVSSSCNWLYIQGSGGAEIIVSNIATLTNGYFGISADGAGTLVDFTGLASAPDTTGNVDLTGSNAGEIRVPSFRGGSTVNISLASGAIMAVAQFQQLSGIAIDGMTENFSSVTNFDEGSISVVDGAVLSLPSLRSYTHSNCGAPNWQVAGAGSLLNLSELTNLISSSCNWIYIQASSGSEIVLSNLTSLSTGYISIISDGAGSVIDLSAMSGMVLANGSGILTARNSGTILLNSQGFLLANVAINIPAGNPVLPPTLIASSTLTLYGQPWQSYLIEQRNTLIPDSPFTVLTRVPLTNAFEVVAPSPPPNTAYLLVDFVANPPQLSLSGISNKVQLVLYGLTNGIYEIQTSTNLAPANWTNFGSVTMTNAFRIFPPARPLPGTFYYRAKQE